MTTPSTVRPARRRRQIIAVLIGAVGVGLFAANAYEVITTGQDVSGQVVLPEDGLLSIDATANRPE